MKKFLYIIPVILLTASSCSSLRFTGAVSDDLYYRPSDQPVVVEKSTTVVRGADQAYYDNIFAADTLIADEYIPENEYVDYASAGEATVINNYYGSSAAERIYLFNSDYFYPYWRDPFYFSPFSMSYGLGYGYYRPYGYSYWGYDPFWYDWYSPYSYYSYYSPYYSPYYSSFYSPYYSPWSGYYSPWYSTYYYSENLKPTVARRGGYSSTARGSYTTSDARRKAADASVSSGTVTSRRVPSSADQNAGTSAGSRRGVSDAGTTTKAGTAESTVSRPEYTRRGEATGNAIQNQNRSQSQVRPENQTRTQYQTAPEGQDRKSVV